MIPCGPKACCRRAESNGPGWIRASRRPHTGSFQAGIAGFRAGDDVGAREAFLLAESRADEPGERAASQLWVGKSYLAQGEVGQAGEGRGTARAAGPADRERRR